MAVGSHQGDSGQVVGTCLLHLQLVCLDLLLEQMEVGTGGEVLTELWHGCGCQEGVGRDDGPLEIGADLVGECQLAELFAIGGFLQQITDFGLLAGDAQEVVLGCHLHTDTELHAVVQFLHLLGIRLEHLHFGTYGDERVVGVVHVGDDLHASLSLLLFADGLTNLCQAVGGCQLSTCIEGQGDIDASQVGASCLQRHADDVLVFHVDAREGAVHLGQILGKGDLTVEFCLLNGIIGSLDLLVVLQRQFATVLQGEAQGLGSELRHSRNGEGEGCYDLFHALFVFLTLKIVE